MTRLQDYFLDLVKTFNECHKNLLQKTTEQDIHKLRTTLKKIKTFNILLDGMLFRQKDFPLELTLLFKNVGEIRDIQIQQNILQPYDDGYKIYLLYMYEDRLKKFKIKEDFTNEIKYLSDKLDKVEDYHIDEQIIINIQLQVRMSYDSIRDMINNISPENLHEIRIRLKRIFYTLYLLGEVDRIEKLDIIQETIGLWHDYDVTIENIRKFDNNLEIIKSLKEKRDSLYKESLELLKEF